MMSVLPDMWRVMVSGRFWMCCYPITFVWMSSSEDTDINNWLSPDNKMSMLDYIRYKVNYCRYYVQQNIISQLIVLMSIGILHIICVFFNILDKYMCLVLLYSFH